jgi:hypothetical protein
MSISLTRKVRNVLTKNRQCNNKNKWSIKHNTCNEILSNSNQLKTGGQFRYENTYFKYILITVEFIFAISHKRLDECFLCCTLGYGFRTRTRKKTYCIPCSDRTPKMDFRMEKCMTVSHMCGSAKSKYILLNIDHPSCRDDTVSKM